MEKSFYELDAPVQRLCGVEVLIPYLKQLVDASGLQKEELKTKEGGRFAIGSTIFL